MTKEKVKKRNLTDVIIESLPEKQAIDIISIDLMNIKNSVADHFIICHAQSKRQVEALADYVLENVRKEKKEKPWHKEGFENAEWILLDYVDVVVHIFVEEKRNFYQLETLWADGIRKEY